MHFFKRRHFYNKINLQTCTSYKSGSRSILSTKTLTLTKMKLTYPHLSQLVFFYSKTVLKKYEGVLIATFVSRPRGHME